MIFFGDFWQLPPVGEVHLMGNPFNGQALVVSKVQKMLSIFWTQGLECLNGLTELHVNKRSGSDVWFSRLVDECRQGELHWENYYFLHGYATNHCGSWLSETNVLGCGNEACKTLQDEIWPKMKKSGCQWKVAQQMECDICAKELSLIHI